jgi:hypothetical protein
MSTHAAPVSILEGVRDFIRDYTGLVENAPVWVQFLGNTPTEYAVLPIAGSRIISEYIDGSSLREYPFALQSMESTLDDVERLETNGFYEAFADWLDEQTEAGNLPDMPEGKTAEEIEALGWGYLSEAGQSGTGIYQVQCRVIYKQI